MSINYSKADYEAEKARGRSFIERERLVEEKAKEAVEPLKAIFKGLNAHEVEDALKQLGYNLKAELRF